MTVSTARYGFTSLKLWGPEFQGTCCRLPWKFQAVSAVISQQFLLYRPSSYDLRSRKSSGVLTHRARHTSFVSFRNICKDAALYCQGQGEDITDLAILWSLTLKNIPTTLISTANINNMMRLEHTPAHLQQLHNFQKMFQEH